MKQEAAMRKAVGYIVTDKGGPQAWCKGYRGLYRLLYAGHSRPRATLFPTHADAKTAVMSEHGYATMVGENRRDLRIVRIETP